MEANSSKECIKIAVATFMPHTIVSGNVTHRVVHGTLLEFFEAAGHILGRCVKYIPEPNDMGGIRLPNGTWTGVMNMLIKNEVDVTSLVVLSQDRAEAFSWSEYLYLEEHTAGYRRPVIESDITGFYKPFSGQVWCLVAAVVVVVPLSHAVLRWAYHQLPRLDKHSMESAETQGHPTMATDVRDSIMWMLSALLAQSLPLRPPRGVVKTLTGLWLLLALILVTVYRSNLKAMLILPKISLPFDNLEQLTQTDLPVWVSLNSVLHAAAMNGEKNSTLGRFNSLINNVGKPNNVSRGIMEFLEGRHVLAGPRSALVQVLHSYFTKTGKCTTYLMSESFLKTNIGCLILQKNSALKDHLNAIIRNWREFGILNRMYQQGVANAEECLKPVSAKLDSWRTLNLEDFYGIFLVYSCGIGIASTVFLVELTLRRLPSLPTSHT